MIQRMRSCMSVFLFLVLFVSAVFSQQPVQDTPEDSTVAVGKPAAGVPRVVRFSGTLRDVAGQALSGDVVVNLRIYDAQDSTAALWSESQTVRADEQGRYSVLLGAASDAGLPAELFASGDARWLEVQSADGKGGQQPRVMLVSVPYALKAADAETLGGRPASDYQLRLSPLQGGGAKTRSAEVQAAGRTPDPAVAVDNGGVNGTVNRVTKWTSATNIGDSLLFDNGTNIGIGTTSPGSKLHITDSIGSFGALRLRMQNTNAGGYTDMLFQNNTGLYAQFGISGSTTNSAFGMGVGAAYLQGGATTGMGTVISAPFILGTNNLERMRIDAGGNIGIGINAPTALLHLNGTAAAAGAIRMKMRNNSSAGYTDILIQNDTTGTAQFGISGSAIAAPFGMGVGAAYLQGGATTGMGTVISAPFILGTNNVERMRIDATGNVGIGTNAPSTRLTVNDATGFGVRLRSGGASNNTSYVIGRTADEGILAIAGVAGNYVAGSSAGDVILATNASRLLFGTGSIAQNGTARMVVDNATGRVGIGTLTPSTTLDVSGIVRSSTGGFKFPDATTQLTGIPSCNLNEIPKWTGAAWGCSTDATTGGGISVPLNLAGSTASAIISGTQNNSVLLLSDPTFAFAQTSIPAGVVGIATATANTAVGVAGFTSTPNAPGVVGWNGATGNLNGGDAQGVLGIVDNPAGIGVSGEAHASTGTAFGVKGSTRSPDGIGVKGAVDSSDAGGGIGVKGESGAVSGIGVRGEVNGTTATGLYSFVGNGGTGLEVEFFGTGNLIHATSAGQEKFKVDSQGDVTMNTLTVSGGTQSTFAGGLQVQTLTSQTPIQVSGAATSFFAGSLSVGGTLSKGAGSFKIDHPLDPARKYLYHSFVESPDMMNIYNGVVTLDAKGRAWIDLPEWFEALNRDFRYQLTALGRPAPNLYVAREVAHNRFQIAGGRPNARVSWQVTGIRHDAYADANRIRVEETKPPAEQGTYLHPELFAPRKESVQNAGRSRTAAHSSLGKK
ncbi:MAG: hypothetical protein HYX26_05925 [Acidobacteriales bacterium]|nr:hypothetical protein [Terriglobales bacterium]